MNYLKAVAKYLVPYKVRHAIRESVCDRYYAKSYSQEGEDMILRRLFERTATGFYVDVGAHHPRRFSNTYYFYKKGWKGINIDAKPGSMQPFKKLRPRDINIEIAISSKRETLTYHMFDEPALNGFTGHIPKSVLLSGQTYKRIGTTQIQALPLSDVLAKHIKPNTEIQFLSVDVEGFDLQVIQSNDWLLYRPIFIVVEITDIAYEKITATPVAIFLCSVGYAPFAKCLYSVIFKKIEG